MITARELCEQSTTTDSTLLFLACTFCAKLVGAHRLVTRNALL